MKNVTLTAIDTHYILLFAKFIVLVGWCDLECGFPSVKNWRILVYRLHILADGNKCLLIRQNTQEDIRTCHCKQKSGNTKLLV